MKNEYFYLFTFSSTHSAMEAQKLLADCKPIIMPTLRKIAATCGISIRIGEENIKSAQQIVESFYKGKNLVTLYKIERVDKEDFPVKIAEY